MPAILDTPGKRYTGETFTAPVHIHADGVTLEGCVIDGKYDASYGLYIDYKTKRKRYRFTQMLGGTITRCVRKAAVVSFTRLDGVTIEDIGSDGVFFAEEGFVEVKRCTIRDYGWVPGAHADGIQAMLGSNYRILQNRITNPHGVANPNGGGTLSSNSCIFLEAQTGNLDRLTIAGNVLDGGLYSLRVRDEKQGFRATSVVVRGNEFKRHYYAPYLLETRERPLFDDTNDLTGAVRFRP